jgi:hypothetical protein
MWAGLGGRDRQATLKLPSYRRGVKSAVSGGRVRSPAGFGDRTPRFGMRPVRRATYRLRMADPEFAGRGVLLALRFEPRANLDPRPEEIGSVLEAMEGLYRAAPASAALGVPIADLLAAHHMARAEATVGYLSPDWYELPPWLSPAEFDEMLDLLSRARRRGERRWTKPGRLGRDFLGYGPPSLPPPENAMRVRRLSMGSPLDFVAHIPAEYWQAGGFILFLKAVEAFFNMPQRIRTERIDLRARQAERRATERESELREERAARELDGLRRVDVPLQLVDGEVRPDDEPRDA